MYKVVEVCTDEVIEHYEIYENGKLVATCNDNELKETVDYIESCQ